MDKYRFIDKREHRFLLFEPTADDPTLVICPQCAGMGKVFLNSHFEGQGYEVRTVCLSCGFSRQIKTDCKVFDWGEDEPSDGYFDYPLWLVMPCCGHSLWVFNKRHLDFLESFVRAELRGNPQDGLGYANSSLASRLPKWIKAGKNRKPLLEAIKNLRFRGCYASGGLS